MAGASPSLALDFSYRVHRIGELKPNWWNAPFRLLGNSRKPAEAIVQGVLDIRGSSVGWATSPALLLASVRSLKMGVNIQADRNTPRVAIVCMPGEDKSHRLVGARISGPHAVIIAHSATDPYHLQHSNLDLNPFCFAISLLLVDLHRRSTGDY